MNFKRISPLFLFILLPACSVPGDAAWSDIHMSGYAAVYPVGLDAAANDISVNDSSGSGITFDGDLSMEKNRETGFFYGARAGIAPFELSVSSFGYDGQHSSNVAGGATFTGVPIPVTEDLATSTDMDLGVTKLMLGVDLINTPAGRAGFMAGVDFLEFDRFVITATETISVLGVPINQSVPVPMIGVRGDIQLPYGIRLGGEFSGLTTNVDTTDITYLDMDINANYEPTENVELVVGYHRIDIDVSGTLDEATLDVTMVVDGPYFGVSLYW